MLKQPSMQRQLKLLPKKTQRRNLILPTYHLYSLLSPSRALCHVSSRPFSFVLQNLIPQCGGAWSCRLNLEWKESNRRPITSSEALSLWFSIGSPESYQIKRSSISDRRTVISMADV